MFEFAGVGKWASRNGWDTVCIYRKQPDGARIGITHRVPNWYNSLWPQVDILCRAWWWRV